SIGHSRTSSRSHHRRDELAPERLAHVWSGEERDTLRYSPPISERTARRFQRLSVPLSSSSQTCVCCEEGIIMPSARRWFLRFRGARTTTTRGLSAVVSLSFVLAGVITPTFVLQELIAGLSIGAIYALIALGYTMVYGIIELINFAHGDVFMIGSFVAIVTLNLLGDTGELVGWTLIGTL